MNTLTLDTQYALMRELMELPGPTGQESRVMDWLRQRWEGKADRVWTAKSGNVYAHVGGNGPMLLVEGHADELSFMVREISPNGFIWLASGQASRPDLALRYPIGHPGLIVTRTGTVEGVFATTTGHILTDQQKQNVLLGPFDMFLDIGAESREEVLERGVRIGNAIIWNPPTRRLGNRVVGKAVDDRFALAIMTMLIEELDPADLKYDLYVAATIQEEIGLVGANSLRREIDADLGIALDNGPVGDIPTVDPRRLPTKLGGGPTLVHKSASTHYNQDLIWKLDDIATANNIPVQHAVWEQIGTDGDAMMRDGIPTALIGLATRYTHSPLEMYDLRDFDWSWQLLKAFVTT